MADPFNDSFETNTMISKPEEGTDVSENMTEENHEDKQVSSEDSEEDSDDDVVVAAGNFTLSSIETNMVSLSQQNNASPSTSGINLKRNNLLTLTNIPGISAGTKVSKTFVCIIFTYLYN